MPPKAAPASAGSPDAALGDSGDVSKKRIGSKRLGGPAMSSDADYGGETPFMFKMAVYQPPTPNASPRSEVCEEPPAYSRFVMQKPLLLVYGATSQTGRWMVRQALSSGLFRVRAFCRSREKLEKQQRELDEKTAPNPHKKEEQPYEPPLVKTRAQLPGLDDILFGAHLEEERIQNCSRVSVRVTDLFAALPVVPGATPARTAHGTTPAEPAGAEDAPPAAILGGAAADGTKAEAKAGVEGEAKEGAAAVEPEQPPALPADQKDLLEVVEGDIEDLDLVRTAMRDATYVAILVRPEKVEPYMDFIRAVTETMSKPGGMTVVKMYLQGHAELPEPISQEMIEANKKDPKCPTTCTGLSKDATQGLFQAMVHLKRECPPSLPWFVSRPFPLQEGPTAWKPKNNVIGFPPEKKPAKAAMRFSGASQWALLLLQNRALWLRQFPYLAYGTDHLQYYHTGAAALTEMTEPPAGATEEEQAAWDARMGGAAKK
ncbi:unnamed protein product [Amoebophrya sp. A25]|nr:unnamed protein product [Amoebophrya sp. A25]|eukprot:GSA25T00016979001.1